MGATPKSGDCSGIVLDSGDKPRNDGGVFGRFFLHFDVTPGFIPGVQTILTKRTGIRT